MVEIKSYDTIDWKLLKRIVKTERTVLVGHSDAEKAEIAKKLYFGSAKYLGGPSPEYDSPRGRRMGPHNIPARPYLTDAFEMGNSDFLQNDVGEYYDALLLGGNRAHTKAEAIGHKLAVMVVDFVDSNPYAETKPNAQDVIEDKGFNHPLVDAHSLMDSVTSKVVLNGK